MGKEIAWKPGLRISTFDSEAVVQRLKFCIRDESQDTNDAAASQATLNIAGF